MPVFRTGVSTLGTDTLEFVQPASVTPPFVPVTVRVVGLIRSPSASGVGALPYLVSVKAYPDPGVPVNDSNGMVENQVLGTVTPTADDATYVLILETIDSWRIGSTVLTPPYTAYWKIVEHYSSGREVIRKVRPLSTGGATQRVLDILV